MKINNCSKIFNSRFIIFLPLLVFSFFFVADRAHAIQNISINLSPSSFTQGSTPMTLSGDFAASVLTGTCQIGSGVVPAGYHHRDIIDGTLSYEILDSNGSPTGVSGNLTAFVDYAPIQGGVTVICGSPLQYQYDGQPTLYRFLDVQIPSGSLPTGSYSIVFDSVEQPPFIETGGDCQAYEWATPSFVCGGTNGSVSPNNSPQVGFGPVTPANTCNIASFTADSTNLPNPNSGTTLHFNFGGASYPWSISLQAGATSPSPNSSTGTGASPTTGALSDTHTYILDCNNGEDTQPLTVTVDAPAGPYNDAVAISHTIPATMNAGQTLSVNVTMQNTGTTTWTSAGNYKLGAEGNNTTWVPTARVNLGSGESITPGQQKTFTFNITAPSTPGTYSSNWAMVQEYVQWFGGLSYHNVNVIPPPPINGTGSCNSAGTQGTFSWAPPASGGYTHFYTRANLSSNGFTGTPGMPGWNEDYVGPPYTVSFATNPGSDYTWWVHTRDAVNPAIYSSHIWGSFTCTPSSMTGSLTDSTSCTIASGQSTCSVPITWSVTNPVGATSNVTSNTPAPNTVLFTDSTIPHSGNGSVTVTGTNPSGNGTRSIFLNNNAQTLDSATMTASCAPGTTWNGSICVVNGLCSTTLNTCIQGTFQDVTDNSTHYLWQCNGSSGGTNASCSLAKAGSATLTPTDPIVPNGGCTTLTWVCPSGTVSATINGVSTGGVLSGNRPECPGVTTVFTLACLPASGPIPPTVDSTITVRKTPFYIED